MTPNLALILTTAVATARLAAPIAGQTTPPPTQSIVQLTSGQTVDRELARGVRDTFRIALDSAAILHMVLTPNGMTPFPRVLDPAGNAVAGPGLGNPLDTKRSAPRAGVYLIVVMRVDTATAAGHYKLRVDVDKPK